MYTGYVRDITDRVARERELRASRARIVAAADEARRRLERDLHDGAQSRLLAVGLDLKLLQAGLEPGRRRAARRRPRGAAARDRGAARARARHPSRGADRARPRARPCGRSCAGRRSTVGLEYDSEDRCPAAVEAAAYFLAAEALTNVARYARASRADVRVSRPDGALAIEIADDGVGGADAAAGSGLRGMADRLAALDGTLEVDSPPGGGTRVRGVIPCAS